MKSVFAIKHVSGSHDKWLLHLVAGLGHRSISIASTSYIENLVVLLRVNDQRAMVGSANGPTVHKQGCGAPRID